jgi:hypothetical protein
MTVLSQMSVFSPVQPCPYRSLQIMISSMLALSQQLQILNSIVKCIVVLMVNFFLICKISSNMFFHNQPMFQHIATCIAVWMLRGIYTNITTSAPPTTLPVLIIWSSLSFPFLKMASVAMPLNELSRSSSNICIGSSSTTSTSTENNHTQIIEVSGI